MVRFGDILVAALSVGAPTIMLSMPLIEPILYKAELLNREVLMNAADIIRLIAGLMIIVLIYHFARYAIRCENRLLKGKQSLWVWLLVLGNVFTVPVFWFLVYRPSRIEYK